MLNKLTIKGRMFIILGAILALFVTMIFFSVHGVHDVKDLGLHHAGEVLLADQKARIQLASHTMAVTLEQAFKMVDTREEQIEVIRRFGKNLIYETDKSGYFFFYEGTTNISTPVKTELHG